MTVWLFDWWIEWLVLHWLIMPTYVLAGDLSLNFGHLQNISTFSDIHYRSLPGQKFYKQNLCLRYFVYLAHYFLIVRININSLNWKLLIYRMNDCLIKWLTDLLFHWYRFILILRFWMDVFTWNVHTFQLLLTIFTPCRPGTLRKMWLGIRTYPTNLSLFN